MASHTLYFDSGLETTSCQCDMLSHWHGSIKALSLEGTRHSLDSAARMLRSGKGKIYFHSGGHKFRPCSQGYKFEAVGCKLLAVSLDTRIVPEPKDFWQAINRDPFDTPLLPEWESAMRLALQGAYLKPLAGHNASGEYLDHSLTPFHLDRIVCGLVKRKVVVI